MIVTSDAPPRDLVVRGIALEDVATVTEFAGSWVIPASCAEICGAYRDFADAWVTSQRTRERAQRFYLRDWFRQTKMLAVFEKVLF